MAKSNKIVVFDVKECDNKELFQALRAMELEKHSEVLLDKRANKKNLSLLQTCNKFAASESNTNLAKQPLNKSSDEDLDFICARTYNPYVVSYVKKMREDNQPLIDVCNKLAANKSNIESVKQSLNTKSDEDLDFICALTDNRDVVSYVKQIIDDRLNSQNVVENDIAGKVAEINEVE